MGFKGKSVVCEQVVVVFILTSEETDSSSSGSAAVSPAETRTPFCRRPIRPARRAPRYTSPRRLIYFTTCCWGILE